MEFHFLEKLNCTQRTPENQILINQIPIRRISISHSVEFQMIEFQFVANLIPIIPNTNLVFPIGVILIDDDMMMKMLMTS